MLLNRKNFGDISIAITKAFALLCIIMQNTSNAMWVKDHWEKGKKKMSFPVFLIHIIIAM